MTGHPGQIASLTARLAAPPGVIVTHYRGLSTAELTELRLALAGRARYEVTKNTLARMASGPPLDSLLTGPTALAFVERDIAEAAAVLHKFSRDHPALVVRGALLDGTLLTAAALEKLESRQALLGQLAGAMRAQTTRMALLAQALKEKRDGEAQQH